MGSKTTGARPKFRAKTSKKVRKIIRYEIKQCNIDTLKDKCWLDDIILDSFISTRTRTQFVKEHYVKIGVLDSIFYQSLLMHGPTDALFLNRA